MTYSKGLRERYGLRDPKTDEEAARDDPENETEVVAVLPKRVLKSVRRRGLLSGLLSAVEDNSSWLTVVLYLKRNGIEAYEPPGFLRCQSTFSHVTATEN